MGLRHLRVAKRPQLLRRRAHRPPRSPALSTVRVPILRALKRYEDAYEKMNVEAIGEIYTGLLRETSQDLKRQFQNCRAYDVTFANTDVTIGNDPTAATVSVRPHTRAYTEEPARAAGFTSSEVFAS